LYVSKATLPVRSAAFSPLSNSSQARTIPRTSRSFIMALRASYLRHSGGHFLSGLCLCMSLIKPLVSKANRSVDEVLFNSHESLAMNVHCRFNQDRSWPH
jgi:hypothetical protein